MPERKTQHECIQNTKQVVKNVVFTFFLRRLGGPTPSDAYTTYHFFLLDKRRARKLKRQSKQRRFCGFAAQSYSRRNRHATQAI